MFIWKCKYYNVCGSLDNCNCCSGKQQLLKEDLQRQFLEILRTIVKDEPK